MVPCAQPLHVLDAVRLAVEHLDEGAADGLALGLGSDPGLSSASRNPLGVHAGDVEAQVPVALQHASRTRACAAGRCPRRCSSRRSPMARSSSMAATLLSTPPLRAITTRSLPSSSLQACHVCSTKPWASSRPGRIRRCRSRSCAAVAGRPWCGTPRGGTARRRSCGRAAWKAATGTSAVLAITSMASLGAVMVSPWLIHTWCRPGCRRTGGCRRWCRK
jgi:hypothetical protein